MPNRNVTKTFSYIVTTVKTLKYKNVLIALVHIIRKKCIGILINIINIIGIFDTISFHSTIPPVSFGPT